MSDLIPTANTPPLTTFGHATPDMSTQVLMTQQMQQQLEMGKTAMRTDRQVQALTAAMALYMHGGDRRAAASFLTQTDSGKILRDVVGLTSAGGLLGGGSPVTMMAGLQQFVTGSHMRVGDVAMSGSGAVTNKIAESFYLQMQKEMYNKVTGAPNMALTHGFDRTRLGETFAMMGSTGALSGVRAADQLQLKNGQYEVRDDPAVWGKVKTEMEKYTRFLSTVRDVFGDRSVAELGQIAERVTGLSVGPNSTDEISRRLKRLRTLASTTGMSEQHLLEATAQITDQLTPAMGRPAAGAAAQQSVRAMVIGGQGFRDAQGRFKDAGMDVDLPDEERIQAVQAAQQQEIMKEPEQRAAWVAMAAYGDQMNPAKKQALDNALENYKNARTPDEIGRAGQGVTAALNDTGFGQLARGMSEKQQESMIAKHPEIMQRRAEAYAHAGQARNINPMLYQFAQDGDLVKSSKNPNAVFGDVMAASQSMFEFTDIFDQGTQAKLLAKWTKGETPSESLIEEAKRQYIKDGGKTEEQWNKSVFARWSKGDQTTEERERTKRDAGKYFGHYQNLVAAGATNPMPAASRSKALDKEIADSNIKYTMKGGLLAADLGGMSSLLEGIADSSGPVTAQDAMRVGLSTGQFASGVDARNFAKLDLKDGRWEATDETLQKLNDQSGGKLFKTMNVTSPESAQKLRQSNPERFQRAVVDHLEENGYAFNAKTSQATVGTKKDVEKQIAHIERIKDVYMERHMSAGASLDDKSVGALHKEMSATVARREAAGYYDSHEEKMEKAMKAAGKRDARSVVSQRPDLIKAEEGMEEEYSMTPTDIDKTGAGTGNTVNGQETRAYKTGRQYKRAAKQDISYSPGAYMYSETERLRHIKTGDEALRTEALKDLESRGVKYDALNNQLVRAEKGSEKKIASLTDIDVEGRMDAHGEWVKEDPRLGAAADMANAASMSGIPGMNVIGAVMGQAAQATSTTRKAHTAEEVSAGWRQRAEKMEAGFEFAESEDDKKELRKSINEAKKNAGIMDEVPKELSAKQLALKEEAAKNSKTYFAAEEIDKDYDNERARMRDQGYGKGFWSDAGENFSHIFASSSDLDEVLPTGRKVLKGKGDHVSELLTNKASFEGFRKLATVNWDETRQHMKDRASEDIRMGDEAEKGGDKKKAETYRQHAADLQKLITKVEGDSGGGDGGGKGDYSGRLEITNWNEASIQIAKQQQNKPQ